MQKSSKSSQKHVLFLLILAAVLLAAVGLALYRTRSQALLGHTTDVLPDGSVWLSTSFPLVERYHTEGRASEAPLSDGEVQEFLRLVQEGWTGEVLPFGQMADGGGLLRVWFCEGQVDDPRARGHIPQVSFMVYDRKTIENLQSMAAHTGVGDLANLPYSYGLFTYWVPTDESFDFESIDCAAFYPLTAEGWQALADWMDAKLAAAGTQ